MQPSQLPKRVRCGGFELNAELYGVFNHPNLFVNGSWADVYGKSLLTVMAIQDRVGRDCYKVDDRS